MFDNLTVIAVIVIAIWVLALAYYLYLAGQQRAIEEELRELRRMLEEEESEGE